MPHLTIGQVADRAGIRTSHIRFYERVGVLLEVASACECSTVEVSSVFVDPALSPPAAVMNGGRLEAIDELYAVGLDLHVGAHARCASA